MSNAKQTSNAEPTRELTPAELDALIAERSKPENLPAWWIASGLRDDHRQGQPCDSGGRPVKRLKKRSRK